VFRLVEGALARVGRRATEVFSILVPRDGELYFVEASTTGRWLASRKLVV
jgi:hypothetical protein